MVSTVRTNSIATTAATIPAANAITASVRRSAIRLESGGDPFIRRIGDYTVVDLPMRYEAGDMKARVAFDTDEKVAGLLILAPESP